jgi:hypothetical protein
MASGRRLSERWFTLALWLVAFLFAWFLIGLGSLVVGDLPQVERRYSLEQFLDADRARPVAEALRQIKREQADSLRGTEQDQLALAAARSASDAAQETFANWLKTRDATQRVDQDPGLIARTQQLDALKSAERAIEERLDGRARSSPSRSAKRHRSEPIATCAPRLRRSSTQPNGRRNCACSATGSPSYSRCWLWPDG